MHPKNKIMKEKLFTTNDSSAPLILRTLLGMVVFAHGAQKLFGWFGGYGFSGTMGYFTETVGLPWIVGFSVIMLETFGALLLITGFGTRIIALLYTFLALGIMFSTHVQNGFFMNWFGNLPGEGIEYFVLWIGMSVALIVTGGGTYSIDRMITKKQSVVNVY